MAEFLQEQELNFSQVECLTSAMYALARVDGVHDREMSLIREFYESCAGSDSPSLESVVEAGADVERAKSLFGSSSEAALFMKSMILLAFADGTYGKEEDAMIRDYAGAFNVSDEDLEGLISSTKEQMLASLSHLQNVDALADVVRNLSLN